MHKLIYVVYHYIRARSARSARPPKIRAYNDRIVNVEHGTFVPLIFSTPGGMGGQAEAFLKLLCIKN